MTEKIERWENRANRASGPSDWPEHPGHRHTPHTGVRPVGRCGQSRGCPGKTGRADCSSPSGERLHARFDRSSFSLCLEKRPAPARDAGMPGQRTAPGNSLICARFRCDRFRQRLNEPAAAAAAHLTALATGCSRFIRRPLVRCTFFMRSTPAFAGDLALFFW